MYPGGVGKWGWGRGSGGLTDVIVETRWGSVGKMDFYFWIGNGVSYNIYNNKIKTKERYNVLEIIVII